VCAHVSEPPVRNMNLYISTMSVKQGIEVGRFDAKEMDRSAGTRDIFPAKVRCRGTVKIHERYCLGVLLN
jgi:hypothetical protein